MFQYCIQALPEYYNSTKTPKPREVLTLRGSNAGDPKTNRHFCNLIMHLQSQQQLLHHL